MASQSDHVTLRNSSLSLVKKMADEEETIEIVEEEDDNDEEEAAFDEVFEILAVSEELASALQESEEGVELLQLCKDYIKSVKVEEEEYEETISQCQVYQDQLSNENGEVCSFFGRNCRAFSFGCVLKCACSLLCYSVSLRVCVCCDGGLYWLENVCGSGALSVFVELCCVSCLLFAILMSCDTWCCS